MPIDRLCASVRRNVRSPENMRARMSSGIFVSIAICAIPRWGRTSRRRASCSFAINRTLVIVNNQIGLKCSMARSVIDVAANGALGVCRQRPHKLVGGLRHLKQRLCPHMKTCVPLQASQQGALQNVAAARFVGRTENADHPGVMLARDGGLRRTACGQGRLSCGQQSPEVPPIWAQRYNPKSDAWVVPERAFLRLTGALHTNVAWRPAGAVAHNPPPFRELCGIVVSRRTLCYADMTISPDQPAMASGSVRKSATSAYL